MYHFAPFTCGFALQLLPLCRGVVSFSDGAAGNPSGRLFFYLTPMDETAQNLQVNDQSSTVDGSVRAWTHQLPVLLSSFESHNNCRPDQGVHSTQHWQLVWAPHRGEPAPLQ